MLLYAVTGWFKLTLRAWSWPCSKLEFTLAGLFGNLIC